MVLNFNGKDLELFKQKGIKIEEIIRQISLFKNGIPAVKLADVATVSNGAIKLLKENEVNHYLNIFENIRTQKQLYKFTPSSGAATRMFKKLYQFLASDELEPDDDQLRQFFNRIHDFAFFDDLNTVCQQTYGKTVDQLIGEKQYKDVIRMLLDGEGLGYGHLPKALIKFHKYPDHSRTAMEEHVVEAKLYATGKEGKLNLHFTVSPEHKEKFEDLAAQLKQKHETPDHEINFEFSIQDPATDTIAVTPDNEPFRTDEGYLLFRPGGHGALIYNLDKILADFIFIKNIDNVAPDRLKRDTEVYFKVLSGYLYTIKSKIDAYLEMLDIGVEQKDLEDIYKFINEILQIRPKINFNTLDEKKDFARKILNRPLRVVGVVKNLGQPGGGPFLVDYGDFVSPQIVEHSQIDISNPAYKEMLEKSTHFSPTFMVLSIKDYKGQKFNLLDFVDPNASFITNKTYQGREIKALERPGLWNGAMAFWNTVFVEVPLTVFNPVKTVFDLLNPNHQ